jgi:hypothetical protein
MRSFYTLAFIGCICFTGFTAHAQSFGNSSDAADRWMESLSLGGAASGPSSESLVLDVMERLSADPTTTTGPQTSAIEGQLVSDVVEPVINRTTVEVIDTRTGRYAPRLKINFAEFPLRSLNNVNRSHNRHGVQTGTPVEMVVQRIQSRLRVPEFRLAIEDRTAVASGTVSTERERKLIESMLRFEPGISTVRNEITVVP